MQDILKEQKSGKQLIKTRPAGNYTRTPDYSLGLHRASLYTSSTSTGNAVQNEVETNLKSETDLKTDDTDKSKSEATVTDRREVKEDVFGRVSKVAQWRHVSSDCLACVRTRPPSSHELREAFFAELESPMGASSAAESPQAVLLHNVLFMANPIHLRQTRSSLLSLKARHPEVFRSACVYSDVCALLAQHSYLLCARRFLQELFLDTDFDCFRREPAAVLASHAPPAR